MNKNKFILGSGSKWRAQILINAGINVRCVKPNVNEEDIYGDTPEELALNRAHAKAEEVARREQGYLVVGCDQVLGFKNKSYGKADHREMAKKRLKAFSGEMHTLHSAFVLALANHDRVSILHQEVVTAIMTMRPLSEVEIDRYLDTGEWVGCAGGYQFENHGRQLFSKVEGSESTIIGLPIDELLLCLQKLEIEID